MTRSRAASKMESLARPVLNMAEFDQRAGLVMWYFSDVTALKDPHACVPGTLTFCQTLGGAPYYRQRKIHFINDKIAYSKKMQEHFVAAI